MASPSPATNSLVESHNSIGVDKPLSHHACFQNITVQYQRDGFCTRKRDGLYPRSENPETFYKCLLRHTFVTRCHTAAYELNVGAATRAAGCSASTYWAAATSLHLLFVWSNW